MNPHPATIACLLAALAAGGCGLQDPYRNPPHPRSTQASPAPRWRSDDGPAPAPQATHTPTGVARSARAAVRAYAHAYSNWSWRSLHAQGAALAQLAAGPLRAQVLQDARAAQRDAALRRDHTTNHGLVLAIDIRHRGGAETLAVVVVRETAGAQGITGIDGSRLVIYQAAISEIHGRCAITRWEQLA